MAQQTISAAYDFQFFFTWAKYDTNCSAQSTSTQIYEIHSENELHEDCFLGNQYYRLSLLFPLATLNSQLIEEVRT